MELLNIIYWIKLPLGFLAALVCMVLKVNNIFGGTLLSIAIYLLSDRILRQIFIGKISKPSDITKTGLSIYISAWIFFWILLYTFYPY
ncbi:MAG: hypothetical protein QXX94_05855 [Candidatus Bathyarchaeia archaeon]